MPRSSPLRDTFQVGREVLPPRFHTSWSAVAAASATLSTRDVCSGRGPLELAHSLAGWEHLVGRELGRFPSDAGRQTSAQGVERKGADSTSLVTRYRRMNDLVRATFRAQLGNGTSI